MTTNPVADLLIQIKNGYLAQKKEVTVEHSKIKEAIARLLLREKYLSQVTVTGNKIAKKINMELLYEGNKPKLTEVINVSKSSRKVYVDRLHIPKVLGGRGIAILSTPAGILTDNQARKKGIGGEVICKIW